MLRLPFVERFGHNMATGECRLCDQESACDCPPAPDGGNMCMCTCGSCVFEYFTCEVCGTRDDVEITGQHPDAHSLCREHR